MRRHEPAAWRCAKGRAADDPAKLRDALAAATALGAPALVDVVCQPLQEARAPVSEWIA
ncbi:MAG: hypothetical protein ABWY12_12465 [Burkholderiales bacterium]